MVDLARQTHPTWLAAPTGTGAGLAPDIVIVAVDVRTPASAILCGEMSRGTIDPIAVELSSVLSAAASDNDLARRVGSVEDHITRVLRTDYDSTHPPKLYSAAQVVADGDAEVFRFKAILLPVTAVIVLGLGAFFEYRRRTRAGSAGDGESDWFDGDFDDGGD